MSKDAMIWKSGFLKRVLVGNEWKLVARGDMAGAGANGRSKRGDDWPHEVISVRGRRYRGESIID
jgi:hypothetical protein